MVRMVKAKLIDVANDTKHNMVANATEREKELIAGD